MFCVVEIAATFSVVLVLLGVVQRIRRQRTHYPPGPPALPIIGNVHQLPVDRQERKFQEWGHIYGDIIFVRMFHQPAIIINSIEVARELLERRGANYSDRPPLTFISDMMGWDCVVTNFRYLDSRFRRHRKWISEAFQNKDALRGYRPIQHREACTLLLGLISSPDDFESHIKRYAAAMLTEIAYGYRVHSLDDELVALADKAGTETVRAGSPGSNILGVLVEFFPIIKHYPLWMPGSGFKVKTNEIRRHVRRMLDIPYNMVKERAIAGKVVPCFTAMLLEEHLTNGTNALTEANEDDIKGAAGVLYAAGTDTSITVMNSFTLAMVRNPKVFKKAQAEMDRVVGNDRLPDPEDKQSLPYLECILKEVLRWAAPVPLAIPHRSMKADVYQGYEIPAGSMIIPNVWGMLHDAHVYPEPERFLPERFEGLDKACADEIDPRNLAFGFGRRQCPGQQLAEATTWLMAAYIIATMDISPAKDEDGNSAVPPAEFTTGFVLHPKAFKCTIRPRSEKAVNIIKQMSAFS